MGLGPFAGTKGPRLPGRNLAILQLGISQQLLAGIFLRLVLDEGHPGIGYLAIKSGAPVVPASIVWEGPHSVTSML